MQRLLDICFASIACLLLASCVDGAADDSETPRPITTGALGNGAPPPVAPEHEAPSTKYVAGQVWEYRTLPGDTSSRVIIGRVESDEEFGAVYGVYISNVQVPDIKQSGRMINF